MAKEKASKTCKSIIQRGKRKGEACGKALYQDTNMCWGHQPKEVKAEKGFGGAQEGGGRPKLADPFDVAREAVRQHAELLIRPHFKALGYDIEIKQTTDGPILHIAELPEGGAKVYGESKDGEIIPSNIEDLAAQIVAAEKLIDRLYGRPKVAVEHSGGQTFEIVDTTPIERPDHATSVAQLIESAKSRVN